jgi:hypothetical protein
MTAEEFAKKHLGKKCRVYSRAGTIVGYVPVNNTLLPNTVIVAIDKLDLAHISWLVSNGYMFLAKVETGVITYTIKELQLTPKIFRISVVNVSHLPILVHLQLNVVKQDAEVNNE